MTMEHLAGLRFSSAPPSLTCAGSPQTLTRAGSPQTLTSRTMLSTGARKPNRFYNAPYNAPLMGEAAQLGMNASLGIYSGIYGV